MLDIASSRMCMFVLNVLKCASKQTMETVHWQNVFSLLCVRASESPRSVWMRLDRWKLPVLWGTALSSSLPSDLPLDALSSLGWRSLSLHGLSSLSVPNLPVHNSRHHYGPKTNRTRAGAEPGGHSNVAPIKHASR